MSSFQVSIGLVTYTLENERVEPTVMEVDGEIMIFRISTN